MCIFSDIVENTIEVFVDDFSVVGDSIEQFLSHFAEVVKRCEECNLVLNWEKCHFMLKEGIVLGHHISQKGIEVDRAKVEVVESLPPTIAVKGVRSLLRYAGFYLCKPFEVMCEASGVALCVDLGQRRDKILHPIYYASKALNDDQKNDIVTMRRHV